MIRFGCCQGWEYGEEEFLGRIGLGDDYGKEENLSDACCIVAQCMGHKVVINVLVVSRWRGGHVQILGCKKGQTKLGC